MSRKRHTAESITNKLYEADVLESPGAQALFIIDQCSVRNRHFA